MDYKGQRDYLNQHNPFMSLCGIHIIRIRENHTLARLNFQEKLCNPSGTMHGGVLYVMADAVATTAARTNGCNYTTIDGSIHYHRPISEGAIFAEAKVRHRGNTICTVAVELTNEAGELLGDAAFTVFRIGSMDHPAFQPDEPNQPDENQQ